jgi:hypothetical protein
MKNDALQKIDFRIVDPITAPFTEVAKLRYEAYRLEDTIPANGTGQFYDSYDFMDNCTIGGAYYGGELVGSIRFHLISPTQFKAPAYDVFRDHIDLMLQNKALILDPTRFVTSREAFRMFPTMPMLMLRFIAMAAEHWEPDYVIQTVRAEHAKFYQRVFHAEMLSDPREYPGLAKPICLMRSTFEEVHEAVASRYPLLRSTLTERKLLFGLTRH